MYFLGLAPLIYLIVAFQLGKLSSNPIADVTNETGVWTLRFLFLTLLCTPLRKWTPFKKAIRYRKQLGLLAFTYGSLHFLTYIWLDQSFQWNEMVKDVTKRPFITVGFTAFVLMIPLAATSTAWAIRILGKKWQILHRLVYVTSILGVIHYYWLVKADTQRPILYACAFSFLFLVRIDSLKKITQLKPK